MLVPRRAAARYDRRVVRIRMSRSGLIRIALVLGGALPYLAFAFDGGPRWLERWFRFQCHGRAERTLAFGGHPMPVCSRCLGIYTGLLLVGAVALPRLSPRARRAWIVGAAVAMVLEVWIQDSTGHAPIHALRLLTGLLLAWPIALTFIAVNREERDQ